MAAGKIDMLWPCESVRKEERIDHHLAEATGPLEQQRDSDALRLERRPALSSPLGINKQTSSEFDPNGQFNEFLLLAITEF